MTSGARKVDQSHLTGHAPPLPATLTGSDRIPGSDPPRRGDTVTTDDHTCVLLLDDVVLRQVLVAHDADDRAMILRLNLASVGVPHFAGRFIGRARHAAPSATAADRARHPSAGRHAAVDPGAPVREHPGSHARRDAVHLDPVHHDTAA